MRTSSGWSWAYSSISSFVRSSGLPLGTTTFITRYWSPPATPMPGSRTRDPLDVPGGTFTVTRLPATVGRPDRGLRVLGRQDQLVLQGADLGVELAGREALRVEVLVAAHPVGE